MKTKYSRLVISGALAVVATAALAQTNGPTGVSGRVGVLFPSQSSARDISKNWFGVGLDYKLNTYSVESVSAGNPAYVGVSLDYYGHGSTSNIPLALTYNVRASQFVFSAGAGVDFYNLGDIGDGSGTGLGGQLGVAYEFGQGASANNPLFLQAKYFFSSKSSANGLGIYVGYRF